MLTPTTLTSTPVSNNLKNIRFWVNIQSWNNSKAALGIVLICVYRWVMLFSSGHWPFYSYIVNVNALSPSPLLVSMTACTSVLVSTLNQYCFPPFFSQLLFFFLLVLLPLCSENQPGLGVFFFLRPFFPCSTMFAVFVVHIIELLNIQYVRRTHNLVLKLL